MDKPPRGVRHILLVLRIHRIHLLVHHLRGKGGLNEKLRKNVESLVEAFIINLRKVHRLIAGSVSVVGAPIEGKLVGELIFLWIFLGTQKDHVFAEMS